MRQDVYSGCLELNGEEHEETLCAALNYANSLINLRRFAVAKALSRKTITVARRVLGESNELTLLMRWSYADTLCSDPDATIDELREAVTTLEDTASTARRVLGGAHPLTASFEETLQDARAYLRQQKLIKSYLSPACLARVRQVSHGWRRSCPDDAS